MKKRALVCGLVPALTVGICSTSFAQSVTEEAAQATPVEVVAEAAPVETGADNGATAIENMSVQELRAQLQAEIEAAQDLEDRLNARLESMNKRMNKVEDTTAHPRIELHGSAELTYQKHNFEGYDIETDDKLIKLDLNANYKINDRWNIKSESEFINDLRQNKGAYEGDALEQSNWNNYWRGGKKFSHEMKQLYVDGKIGDVGVKVGRYHLDSPQKMTFEDEVDGVQVNYGLPTKWGKANFALSVGNTGNTHNYGNIMMGDMKNNFRINDEYDFYQKANIYEEDKWWHKDGYKLLSLKAEVPVAKDTNIFAHYGKINHRNYNNVSRQTVSLGFDTKIAKDLKFTAATAASDSDNYNRSHLFKLQYREANPAVPGSYSIFVKKYLNRVHTGLSRQFMDDIATPADFARVYDHEGTWEDAFWPEEDAIINNKGDHNAKRDYAHSMNNLASEFNGLCIGAEFVPMKNSKLKLDYTFGDFGFIKRKTGADSGRKMGYGMFSAKCEFYF